MVISEMISLLPFFGLKLLSMKNLFTVIDNKIETLISKFWKSRIESKVKDSQKELFYVNRMMKTIDYKNK